MLLNTPERLLMNNPLRRAIQRRYEAPMLQRMAHRLDGKRVLEIGCGQGFGIELILTHFGAAHVSGIDLDPRMIARAHKRIARYPGRADVSTGDVTAIQAENNAFEAVFDFGIIHHVPVWQDAIREVKRVLKPGGLFLFEEVTKQALNRWVYRTFFDHPSENRFTIPAFIQELEAEGILVGPRIHTFCFGDFFAGVGIRKP